LPFKRLSRDENDLVNLGQDNSDCEQTLEDIQFYEGDKRVKDKRIPSQEQARRGTALTNSEI